jgi:hypothetical protein
MRDLPALGERELRGDGASKNEEWRAAVGDSLDRVRLRRTITWIGELAGEYCAAFSSWVIGTLARCARAVAVTRTSSRTGESS